MSDTLSVGGSTMNSSSDRLMRFATAPSTSSLNFCGVTLGSAPRSSTGQSRTSRWPGGRRSRSGSPTVPVSRRPSRAHCRFAWISLSLRAPSLSILPACPHQARLVALPVAFGDRRALVFFLAALAQAQQHLGPAALVEVDLQRHQRDALARHRTGQRADLLTR